MLLSKLDTSIHYHGKENFDNAQLTTKIPASTRSTTGDVSIKGKKTVVIHRRRLSKRSTANKEICQNGTAAIQSSGEKSSSNKTAASISKSAVGQQEVGHVKLVPSATTAAVRRQEPGRKVSCNKRNTRGTVHARNRTNSKRVSSYRNNQVKEMRDDREEKKNHYRSPVGVKLRLHDMLLEPEISDLTSIPSLRVLSTDMYEKRDDYEAEELPAQESVQEQNGLLSHLIHKTPTMISLEETIVRRGKTPLAEPSNRRCGYRSSYMKEKAVHQGVERGIGNAMKNNDGQEETVYSNPNNKSYQDDEVYDRQGIRDARKSNRHNGIVSNYTIDDNNQTYLKEALKEVTSASYMRVLPQQTIAEIPVLKKNLSGRVEAPVSHHHTATHHPKSQRGVISIPPGIATHFGLSKLPVEPAPHLYTSEVGPVKIAESCSIHGHSNEQPTNNSKIARSRLLLAPSLESEMRNNIKLKVEGDVKNKHGTGAHKAHDSENLMGNEDAFGPVKDLYLTKISRQGNWRRIVSRHIGLKRERSSMKKKNVEMKSEGKNKQLRWNSLFGLHRNRLNSAVSSLSLGYKPPPVHNHIELPSTAHMKTKGKVTVPDLLTDAESTRDSELFTPSDTGADVNDFLSFGLCGLGYLTCMLTEEDLRKKRSDSSLIFPSNRNHLEVIGSNMSNSLTFDESHSSRTESHTGFFKGSRSSLEGNGRDSNFPLKSSEDEPLLKYPTLRSSIEKETGTRLLNEEVNPHHETFPGRSVTFGPMISSGAAPFCFSTFGKSSAIMPGCCIPVKVDGKRGFSVQKRTRKHNQCVPVTKDMMFECNEFFTERKELKGDHIVPVDSGITSASAVKGSLLRIRASKLCNPTKPGGLLKRPMQAKPRRMSSKKSQEGNWRLMKSLLDDDGSSCHQFSESSSNLRTASHEKKHNSRGLKNKKKGKIKKLWAVKLFR
jgi:hypothetical protein